MTIAVSITVPATKKVFGFVLYLNVSMTFYYDGKRSSNELFVKMALDAWNIQIDRTNKLFNALSDDQLSQEVAPGRNSGIYLLGHLTAVHDALFPLLGLGEKLYPELDEIFIKNPDKSAFGKT